MRANHHHLLLALRDAPAAWPADADAAAFLAAAGDNGVAPLLYYRLRESGALSRWPAAVTEALQTEWRRQTALDLRQEHELPRVLKTLSSAGAHALIIKGTALLYTHYPAPGLRPRCDTDLLIERADLPAAEQALQALGYVPQNAVSGEFVSHQRIYDGPITLDLHWKLLNPALLSDIFTAAELLGRSVPLPQLGTHARVPCAVDALLIACIHRTGHHFDHPDRLIWLYDIHLLLESLSPAERAEFAKRAAEKQVREICRDGLTAANECFPSNTFAEFVRLLQNDAGVPEPSAQLLQPDLSQLDLLTLNLRSVHGMDRLRLLREHLLPPAAYMLRKYNTTSRLLLPALYLRRALTGAWHLLK